MEGISLRTAQRRKPQSRPAPAVKVTVRLRPPALKNLFAAENIHGFRAQVEALSHSSTGALHRAYHGGPVSAGFIAAVRLRFPAVPYEQLFAESEDAANGPAHAAA